MFTLSCFLAKFVRSPAYCCKVYKGECSRCTKSKCFFKNSFYLQHGIFSLLLCCKSRGKVVSKETKWSYEKIEEAARTVGRAKDCVRRSLAKVLFTVGGNKLWSHREFCVSGEFGERRALSLLKWPGGEMRAWCRERD